MAGPAPGQNLYTAKPYARSEPTRRATRRGRTSSSNRRRAPIPNPISAGYRTRLVRRPPRASRVPGVRRPGAGTSAGRVRIVAYSLLTEILVLGIRAYLPRSSSELTIVHMSHPRCDCEHSSLHSRGSSLSCVRRGPLAYPARLIRRPARSRPASRVPSSPASYTKQAVVVHRSQRAATR